MNNLRFNGWMKLERKMVENIQNAYDYQNDIDATNFSEILQDDNWIVLQSSGLYDCTKFEDLSINEQENWLLKNKKESWKGKEIFQGHILEDLNNNNSLRYGKDNNLTYVEFYQGSFGLSVIFDGHFVPFYFLDQGYDFKLKIVGNVYQNPELLEYK